MAKLTRLAIFDIDGTIFRSSLIIEVFNALVRAKIFPHAASTRVERHFVRWLDRKGHYNDYLMTLVGEFYRNLKGKRESKVLPVIQSVVEWQKDRVYRFTRDLARGLRRQGYYLLAISNSPDIMIGPFARAAGLQASLGRTYDVHRGRYTGRISVDGKPLAVDAWMDKVALLHSFLKKRGINADLRRSFAVGDSEGDTALLSVVGRPIAFNPSSELAHVARKRGWQIVVERKDVMYVIHDAGMLIAPERQRVAIKIQNSRKRTGRGTLKR
jgi:HAD superfamily hydrolase (TIGR01490 family)